MHSRWIIWKNGIPTEAGIYLVADKIDRDDIQSVLIELDKRNQRWFYFGEQDMSYCQISDVKKRYPNAFWAEIKHPHG